MQPSDMDRISTFLILLAAALLLVPGCIAAEMTTEANTTEVTEVVAVVEETTNATAVADDVNATEVVEALKADLNITSLDMTVDQSVLISLPNDESGKWNTTVSEGLELDANTTMVEGMEEFSVKAIAAGNQTFSAAFMKADATEAEQKYDLAIVVA
ncbi:MAG TPA: hypothetical protein VN372_04385 [Methanospirillum sp.]|nr:hypothetical protein [Methanospirillum sp.]